MKQIRFKAILQKHPNLDAAFIEIPFDVEQEFGKKRVKVRTTIDGALYRGSLFRMGLPCWWLGVTQEIRNQIGKNPGDTVQVVLEEDLEERTVEIPSDLGAALRRNKVSRSSFEKLSYTSKKEFVRWIEDAKREETRKSRIERVLQMLSEGKRGV
jgi:hypothetical protein